MLHGRRLVWAWVGATIEKMELRRWNSVPTSKHRPIWLGSRTMEEEEVNELFGKVLIS